MRTNFPRGNGDSAQAPKDLPNFGDDLGCKDDQVVKFPKKLRYRDRGRILARIYKRPVAPAYRLYWRAEVDGKPKSQFKDFGTYSEALRSGKRIVAEQAVNGSFVLSPGQLKDTRLALETLNELYVAAGKRISIYEAAAQVAAATRKLGNRLLSDAIDGFLSTVANVKLMDISAAVEAFITAEEPRTKALEGERPTINPRYHYNRAIMLRRFAAAFPNTDVCDLTKDHLDAFVASLGKLTPKSRNRRIVASAKSRNHHRAAVRQFSAMGCSKRLFDINASPA